MNHKKRNRMEFCSFLKSIFSDTNKTLAFFTALMAFAAIIAIFLNYYQIRDTHKANRAILARMDNTLKIENRAFLKVYSASTAVYHDSGKGIIDMVMLLIHNKGKTPAYNVDISYQCTSDSLLVDFKNFKRHAFAANIFPDEQLPIREHADNISLKDFYHSNKPLYFWGKIEYLDYFKESHHVHFYYKIMSSQLKVPLSDISTGKFGSGVIFSPMESYNDCD